MNLPLDFNSAEPWTRIVKIPLTIAAVYVIAVVALSVKGNFLGGAVLLVFGLAFYAVLRRARRVSMGAAGRRAVSFRSIDSQPSAWPSASSSYGQHRSRETAGSCSSWGALGRPTSK